MTKINATILSKDEFDAKVKEVERLLAVFDLWETIDMPTQKQETIQIMFNDLSKNLYALDCGYLDAKVTAFLEIEALMKS